MTLDTYENFCPLKSFINNFDNKESMVRHNNDVLLNEVRNSEKLKTVGLILIKNYYSLDRCREFKDKCCTYLNYRIDKEKDLYLKSKSDDANSQWQLIEELWKSLQLVRKGDSYCSRINENESIDKMEKRMNLMVYCKIRDYFKNRCDITKQSSIQQYCKNLPIYINKHYNNFKTDNKCLNIENREKDYSSYFSEDCNLYDIEKTFPQYDSSSGSLLEGPNPRESICKYVNNAVIQVPSEETVAEGPEASSEESTSPQAPLESLPYVSLTLVGFFSLFLFLYRYTTLGSSLRSLITGKNKPRPFIDEQVEQDLLENTLEYKNHNSENDDYTFSYQALQN
ncbi:PIR Superfamily Protein [Plasmodium ovale wallikeri]|uniref:PIR Superfamily Protein n=1 Tax=Plasmodium ovale wallikeri TaxID=864142 RepID=A0A1A9AHB0_PLAOA|nr:PIR Superfamily Protein [Plasmodium ovale wallikeri]SBT55963.1 PIR Superfamily Protein [Plasmodium ovale wallikeri]